MAKLKTTDDIELNEELKEDKRSIQVPKILQMQEYLSDYYSFRLNTVTFNLEKRLKGTKEFVKIEPKDKADLIIKLKSSGFPKPKEDLDDILQSSFVAEYNPIQDYFNNLEYKGKGYIDALIGQVVIDNSMIYTIDEMNYQQLFGFYFRKWLYACFNCFMGVQKNDVMLILIGAQGRFKTSFLNFLCPKAINDYSFTGHINPSLSDYNTATYLTERIFINVDDQMESIFGKDYNSMKSIISQEYLPIRKLYKANHVRKTRIANFCGSVNEPQFLRDSNNRRYLCFLINDIKPTYNKIDIESLWAEVREEVKEFKGTYLFNKNDFANIDEMNNTFHTPSIEEETLKTIFEVPTLENRSKDTYYLQFSEIMKILKDYTEDKQLKNYMLQTSMRKLKMKSVSKKIERFNNQPRYVYELKLLIDKEYMTQKLLQYKATTEDKKNNL